MKLSYLVTEEDSDKEVKAILRNRLQVSGSLIKRLKLSQNILCNGVPVRVNRIVQAGDLVETVIDFEEECDQIVPENIPLDILFEDDCLLVINKPPFTVVHPTSTHLTGTIANAVMYHLQFQGASRKIRPVSRLDRDTTGIILFAKNEYIQEALIRQMKERTFTKAYYGIVHGTVTPDSGTIRLPIDRKPDSIMLRHVSEHGSAAVTHFEVLERLNSATFLRFFLETGRTHQIRVHCQAIGHPLMGDTLYPYLPEHQPLPDTCTSETRISRQALHSCKVVFTHPFTRAPMEITAPLPADMASLLEITRK